MRDALTTIESIDYQAHGNLIGAVHLGYTIDDQDVFLVLVDTGTDYCVARYQSGSSERMPAINYFMYRCSCTYNCSCHERAYAAALKSFAKNL